MKLSGHGRYACAGDGAGSDGAGGRVRVPYVARGWRWTVVVCGFVLCAGAWSGAALAMTAAQKSACTTVLTLRGWHPPLTLAGDVFDSQAVSLLRQHLRWQQTVVADTELVSVQKR